MKISTLPPTERGQVIRQAEKLKRVIDCIAETAVRQDRFQQGTVCLNDSLLAGYRGRFSGEVQYEPSSGRARTVNLVCQMGGFATLTYKLEGSRYERTMKQTYNERTQVLVIGPDDLDYTSALKNAGPFEPSYDEELVAGPPPVGAKPAYTQS